MQAAYLAKAGKSVAVFERRHLLGGAAVTEEIVPGFKFSRASYLLSLLRPQVVKDLELKVPPPSALANRMYDLLCPHVGVACRNTG